MQKESLKLLNALRTKKHEFGSIRSIDFEKEFLKISHIVTSPEEIFDISSEKKFVEILKDIIEIEQIPTNECLPLGLREWNNSFLGPTQLELLTIIQNSTGYRAKVRSGYRTKLYQSAVFSYYYLTGLLLDDRDRLYVEAPKLSSHNTFDLAFDVEDNNMFFIALLLCCHELKKNNISVFRPNLFSSLISFEPWHWEINKSDCTFVAPFIDPLSQPPLKNILEKYLMYLERCIDSDFEEFIFARKISNGIDYCVGYNEGRISSTIMKLQDELWDQIGGKNYYISFSGGFTPIYDNSIFEEDIGFHTYNITNGNDKSAYITGEACISEQITSCKMLKHCLLRKANINENEWHLISKSQSVDLIIFNDQIIALGRAGMPDETVYAHGVGMINRMISLFIGWVDHCTTAMNKPFYYSNNYANTYSIVNKGAPTRYAFVWWCISSYQISMRYDLNVLAHNLKKELFKESALFEAILSNEYDEHPYNTLVFIIGALKNSSEYLIANDLTELYQNEILDHCCRLINRESYDLIFFGYLSEILPIVFMKVVNFLTIEKLLEILISNCGPSVNSAGTARIIKFLIQNNFKEGVLVGEKYMYGHMNNDNISTYFEDGTFKLLPNILSVLPLEGMLLLIPILNFGQLETRILLDRIHLGFIYLGKLQFTGASGYLSENPSMLIGCFRFSLLDTHIRMDYGFHIIHAALVFKTLLEKYDSLV